MAGAAGYNLKNPAVKRILQELKEIQRDDNPDIIAEVIEDNLFEWHFVIRGAWDTEFEGGIYHGRILMPADYPFKPPAFVMLTPSGRFETGTKICLSISSYHPESWQPSWSVRSALVALIAFMQTPGSGAVGSLDHTADVRREMAASARTTPPKHGNEDRQALIQQLHQRMLDMEGRSRALYTHIAADAPPVLEQSASEAAQPEAVPAAEVVQPVAAAMEEAAAAVVAENPLQPPQLQDATPAAGSVETAAAAVMEAPGPSQPPPKSPPQQPAAPIRQAEPPAREYPAPAQAVGRQHALAAHPGGSESWEDRGLTYLAVLLVVCIAAIMLRRVLGSFRLQPSDEFFAVNVVPDLGDL